MNYVNCFLQHLLLFDFRTDFSWFSINKFWIHYPLHPTIFPSNLFRSPLMDSRLLLSDGSVSVFKSSEIMRAQKKLIAKYMNLKNMLQYNGLCPCSWALSSKYKGEVGLAFYYPTTNHENRGYNCSGYKQILWSYSAWYSTQIHSYMKLPTFSTCSCVHSNFSRQTWTVKFSPSSSPKFWNQFIKNVAVYISVQLQLLEFEYMARFWDITVFQIAFCQRRVILLPENCHYPCSAVAYPFIYPQNSNDIYQTVYSTLLSQTTTSLIVTYLQIPCNKNARTLCHSKMAHRCYLCML